MFVERNIFNLKFGQARPAITMWKDYLEKAHREDNNIHVRMLTDLSGRGYSLIIEQSFNTYAELEPSKCALVNRSDWKEFYQQFIAYCESSERTLYKLQLSF
ncbi:MAG TPA: hypothetical protein VGD17_08665 [Chitinophagaceae bacterium]